MSFAAHASEYRFKAPKALKNLAWGAGPGFRHKRRRGLTDRKKTLERRALLHNGTGACSLARLQREIPINAGSLALRRRLKSVTPLVLRLASLHRQVINLFRPD